MHGWRFVIDFTFKDLMEASTYKELFAILQKRVLPFIEQKAKEEEDGISKANGRKEWLNKWWQMWRRREDMLNEKSKLKRFIAGSRVSTRIFYEFISSEINPNDALICFLFEDDYSFGIIQSIFHIEWLKEKCSTLKGDYRYTGETVWDTFPWPQTPTEAQVKKVAIAAKALYTERSKALKQYHMSLRDLYRLLEQPGANPIKDLHAALDKAVMEAYGFDDKKDILAQLLALNLFIAEKESRMKKVQPPGLPEFVKNKEAYVSDECVRFEWE
ncbi:MAG: hypothetical protein IPP72_06325 [Chitinophagaceae bacterium]|nr:hypothetical protein [Chitinophagaceae bacterium]